MKLKTIAAAAILSGGWLFITSCGEGVQKDEKPVDIQELASKQPETHGAEIKEGDITVSNPLNGEWVTAGKSIYEVKCQSCHRLTEEKLVGPGWKGVTKTRKPVWIMNMITNTEMMLDSDPEAQKLLELCMVRMPNQNLSKDEARHILEFMRNNDGEK
ncbi:MAG: cytochrome c [Chitinophagaceae bacterium]|nr:cytochrome c [Chitinophagaceae bacterium]